MGKEEKREINLRGRKVIYYLKTSTRTRSLRISIKPGGIVAAIKPNFVSDRKVDDFLTQKSEWVIAKIDLLKNKQPILAAGTRADFKRLSPKARALALEKIGRFNKTYRVNFNRVAIRDQSTRWGSCSCKGNLNFNYRIVFLPEHLADYIVVHEMCHLRELNHSTRFWDLVARAIPDYAVRRKELKNGYC
ncbi:MAG: M48 family metallopeptidase [Candidatus Nealsonbacteria bacterium DGGOD1a]|nr:MAG: M48 family metallopeptidase [Candidatus Nealsonbacteria bacterium DGGOD1a]